MPLNERHRLSFINLYCIIFYALLVFKYAAGLLLYQVQPALFNTRFDLLTWLLMDTGLHQWLLHNKAGWIGFDVAFYSLPLLYRLVHINFKKASIMMAVIMLLVNWIYVECYTLFPAPSIESYTAWLLLPLLFITLSLRNFYFLLHGLRYFFLFFFASAGVWKIVQGGLFTSTQMSGILLYQHSAWLVSSPGHWFTTMVYWLVAHPGIAYLLYLAGALLELFFITGFFTRRFDQWLAAAFLLFIAVDFFIMHIYYWETLPFVLVLIFSRYGRPGENATDRPV